MCRSILVGLAAAVVFAVASVAAVGASAATGGMSVVRAVQWPVLRQGTRGERVRVIQYLLAAHGVRVAVNGVFGKSTTAAVMAFQRANRLTADGHVGAATWTKLVVTIKRGSRGDAVRALQHQLRYQYGLKSIVVDGVFGARMQAAVWNFQRNRRLRVDGIVGTATWKAIESNTLVGYDIDYGVDVRLTVTAPTGTRVTFANTTYGNCANHIKQPGDEDRSISLDGSGRPHPLFRHDRRYLPV